MKKSVLFISLGMGFSFVASLQTSYGHSSPPPVLRLEGYMDQVRTKNAGVKSAYLGVDAGMERSGEGQLLLAPTFYMNLSLTSDARIPQFAFLAFDTFVSKNFTFGISQLTTFGLSAKLHYDLVSQYYVNPYPLFQVPGGTGGSGPFLASYANASPVIELTQSLWGNGFGRSTKATQIQLEAQALSSSYNQSFQTKSLIVKAETTYWRLALARQSVKVQGEALDRANRIKSWNQKQARFHLKEDSDLIQSEALVQSRQLQLAAAINEERSASREFNSQRFIDSEKVMESLPDFSNLDLTGVSLPKKTEFRDDVKAAQEASRAAVAGSTIALERDAPTLEVFASLALNGQKSFHAYSDFSDTIPRSFALNRPTETVGVRFSAPIDFSLLKTARSGWTKEQQAAELALDRRLFEQEQGWKDLNESYNEAKDRLDLNFKLEKIQQTKLEIERKRLERGRTTTYQVLLFEQDYLLAQLSRIQNQTTILNLIAQMKLFGEKI